MKQVLIKNINLENFEDFTSSFDQTFGHFRDSNAIISYGSCIQKLPEQERDLAIPIFKLYFTSVMKGTFYKTRYDLSKSVHLKEVFENRPELLVNWKKGDHINGNQLLEWKQSRKTTVNFYKFIKDKIYDNDHLARISHRISRQVRQDGVTDCLNCQRGCEKCGLETISDYPFLERAFESEEHTPILEEIENIEKKTSDLILQKKIIAFLNNRMDIDKVKEAISELLTIVPKDREFYSDLIAYKRRFSTRRLDVEKLVVIDTDDPEDLLLIGTETTSCQRVNGNPHYNKCLLAYLLDGKIRAIVVKGKNGRIVARCILKILIDEKTGKPVLFKEKIYSNSHDSIVNKLINAMCLRRSKQLNLPLLTERKNEKYPKYKNDIESKSSISPFEYVDALGGKTKGKYQINESIQIN